MLLTDYTTYDEVRAVLGVDKDELTDATLSLEVYQRSLELELLGIGSTLLADFATVQEIPEASRTAAEKRFFATTKVFVPYAVGVQLSSGISLFAPKSITDGKAGTTRDSGAAYKAAVAACAENYNRFRAALLEAYGTYKGSVNAAVLRPYFAVVSPSSDPVTGS